MSQEEQDAVHILLNYLKGIPNPPTEKAPVLMPSRVLQIPRDQILLFLLDQINSPANENDTQLQAYSNFGEYVLDLFIEQLRAEEIG